MIETTSITRELIIYTPLVMAGLDPATQQARAGAPMNLRLFRFYVSREHRGKPKILRRL
jgi:hypothetical protein